MWHFTLARSIEQFDFNNKLKRKHFTQKEKHMHENKTEKNAFNEKWSVTIKINKRRDAFLSTVKLRGKFSRRHYFLSHLIVKPQTLNGIDKNLNKNIVVIGKNREKFKSIIAWSLLQMRSK